MFGFHGEHDNTQTNRQTDIFRRQTDNLDSGSSYIGAGIAPALSLMLKHIPRLVTHSSTENPQQRTDEQTDELVTEDTEVSVTFLQPKI